MADTTAAAAAATSVLPGRFAEFLQLLKGELGKGAEKLAYTPQSEAQLRANLEAAYKPSLEQSLRQRLSQAAVNKAAIDADASARGIGASTWVTDAKNRQQNNAAQDSALLRANYGASVAQQLISRLADQEAKQLEVDKYNANQDAARLSQALSTAQAMYPTWLKEAGGIGGGGSSGGSSGSSSRSSGSGPRANPTEPGYGGNSSGNVVDNSISKAWGAATNTAGKSQYATSTAAINQGLTAKRAADAAAAKQTKEKQKAAALKLAQVRSH